MLKAYPKDPKDRFMDLRDYFAIRAMQVRMPQIRELYIDGKFEDWEGEAIPFLAKDAYVIADAMLKAREESSQNDTK